MNLEEATQAARQVVPVGNPADWMLRPAFASPGTFIFSHAPARPDDTVATAIMVDRQTGATACTLFVSLLPLPDDMVQL